MSRVYRGLGKCRITTLAVLCIGLVIGLGYLIRACTTPQLPALPVRYEAAVKSALVRAGDNRIELVRALAHTKGAKLPALCDMISRMPNHDLSQVSSRMLLEHIDCTFAVNERVPWKLKTDSRLFLDYVLPYRVSCESMEDSRRELMRITYPLVKSCEDPRVMAQRVVAAVNINVYVAKASLGSAWPYDFGALSHLYYGGRELNANCRGRTLRTVAMLRSVGIPARIVDRCATQWYTTTHVAPQYFDSRRNKWSIWEAGEIANGDRLYMENGEAALYALCPYMHADLLGKEMYDQLTCIGTYTYPSGRVEVAVNNNGSPVEDAWVSVLVWNMALTNWSAVFRAKTSESGRAAFNLGSNPHVHPYMICAGKGKDTTYTFLRLRAGSTCRLAMDISKLPDTGMIDIK